MPVYSESTGGWRRYASNEMVQPGTYDLKYLTLNAEPEHEIRANFADSLPMREIVRRLEESHGGVGVFAVRLRPVEESEDMKKMSVVDYSLLLSYANSYAESLIDNNMTEAIRVQRDLFRIVGNVKGD